MLLVTGWTTLGDDIRNLGPNSLDPFFYSLIIVCILIFTFDIIMSIKLVPDYFPSTYFIVD